MWVLEGDSEGERLADEDTVVDCAVDVEERFLDVWGEGRMINLWKIQRKIVENPEKSREIF
jgi:hypothetical protein